MSRHAASTTKKRSVWTVVVAIGLLLLLGAAGLTAFNTWDNQRAGQHSSQVMQQLEGQLQQADTKLGFDDGNPTMMLDGYEYIGVIEIPAVGMKLPVMSNWNYNRLNLCPCRFSGACAGDNLVICAHNYETHFGVLAQLKGGEPVRLTLVDGKKNNYVVSKIEVVAPTEVEKMSAKGPDDTWALSLFTCDWSGRARQTIRCDRA